MSQVLKKEIYERIYNAGIEEFYQKDFRSAKMKDIADRAGIPVGLVYSYFKNKKALFEKIILSVHIDYDRLAKEETSNSLPYEKYKIVAESYLLGLLENHKILVILFDKSKGTSYGSEKDVFIGKLEKHIKIGLAQYSSIHYDDMLIHILASNFVESFLEIARHYKNKEFAYEMLNMVTQCYYKGVDSL